MDNKNKKLPSGGMYRESMINDKLRHALDLFLQVKREEEDYLWCYASDLHWETLVNNDILRKMTRDDRKINPRTGKKVNWIRIYKSDLDFVLEKINNKPNKNYVEVFYDLVKKKCDLSLSFSDFKNLFEPHNNFESWVFKIIMLNSFREQIGISNFKFQTNLYSLKNEFELETISTEEFFDLIKNKSFEINKRKKYFNSIKRLRNLFCHFWNYTDFSTSNSKDNNDLLEDSLEGKSLLRYFIKNNFLFLIINDKSIGKVIIEYDFLEILKVLEKCIKNL